MHEREVMLFIEADPTEAVLAGAAAALRSDVRVLRAADLRAGAEMLGRANVGLAVLGRQALAGVDAHSLQPFVSASIPVVGLAGGLAPDERERALAAGVREVRERPARWPAYRNVVGELLERWLPNRTG